MSKHRGSLLVLLAALQLLLAAPAVTARALRQQPGQANTKQCACPLILAPVCGADGKQYSNKCLAECVGVLVTREQAYGDAAQCRNIAVDPVGPVRPQTPVYLPRPLNTNTNSAAAANGPSCKCPRYYSPVCGSDGKVYNNKCLAECQQGVTVTDARPDARRTCPPALAANGGRRLQSTSSANQAARACPCPRIYRPVCGSNGKQYDNECIAKCDGVGIYGPSNGGCPSSPSVVPSIVPSAAGPSGQVTTTSQQPAGPVVAQPGPVAKPTSKPQTPGAGVPQQQQLTRPVATKTDQAAGQPVPNPRQEVGQFGWSCGCELTYEPVCGKDAKWYPNPCSLTCAGVGLSAVRPDRYRNCLMV